MRLWGIGMLVWLVCSAAPVAARAQVAGEYQVKAAFLYNFIKFVSWPEESFPDTNSPIVIGLLGEDPFGQTLNRVVEGKSISNRPVVLRRSHSLSELSDAHLVFISRSENGRVRQILREVRRKPVLTVSEIDRFCERGGIINFTIRDNKIRFQINPEAARTSGLRISSKLLSLATIVPTELSDP